MNTKEMNGENANGTEVKEMSTEDRERKIYKTTLAGSVINVVLLVTKFAAGIIGGSAAMIADAVHSLSDFLTDIIVVVFVHISSKPEDKDHDYGHGKYETLATSIIGLGLLVVGFMILFNGNKQIWDVLHGKTMEQPGMIAFIAALLSITLKEWAYQFTVRTGRKVNSQAVIANAWHHRSDAFSSIGTAVGIGGAILLGHQWVILDPIAAVVVSLFIIRTALGLIRNSSNELLEKSLPDNVEAEIVKVAESEANVSEVHHLCTRRIGNNIAIEMHLRMPGDMSLYQAHLHATHIEKLLRMKFGSCTHINIHVEPLKVDGLYVNPTGQQKH